MTNIKSMNISKIHPVSGENSGKPIFIVKFYKHFLTMNSHELLDRNIYGVRNSLAISLQNQLFGYFSAFISVVFVVLMYVWLAIEGEIYDSSTATTVLHIFELVLMCYFLLEIMTIILAYGPKLFFSDWINILEIPIILTLMVILILDLIDDKYRVEGLYRVIRVILAFLRVRSAIV